MQNQAFRHIETQGRRWVISGHDETRAAAVEIASQAARSLTIFTQDLEPGIYDHDSFMEVAKRLVLSKRYGRIRLLLADPGRAMRNGNRFVYLARRLNTYIAFRNVHPDYREAHGDAYVIADDQALLYRADASNWEGIADTHAPAVAQRYLTKFDEIWEASEVQAELRDLRL